MEKSINIGTAFSLLFGLLCMGIGTINTFWGNDPGYGIFVFLLSFIFFPPANAYVKKLTGRTIPIAVKIVVGFFIIWSALGVAELFDKIELMMMDF